MPTHLQLLPEESAPPETLEGFAGLLWLLPERRHGRGTEGLVWHPRRHVPERPRANEGDAIQNRILTHWILHQGRASTSSTIRAPMSPNALSIAPLPYATPKHSRSRAL